MLLEVLNGFYANKNGDQGEGGVLVLEEKWGKKYALSVKPWITHWDNIKTFFKFPNEIRRLIYTTNAVESLHRQFGKVIKTKSVFPSDQSLLKMLFLASREISKKWNLPVRGWKEAIFYFGIAYYEKIGFLPSQGAKDRLHSLEYTPAYTPEFSI